MRATFQFTCDNAQLALNEVALQVQSLGLEIQNEQIAHYHPVDHEEDWFDDCLFEITADVLSDRFEDAEIDRLLENGPFEFYEKREAE